MTTKKPYYVLGVTDEATPSDIRAAYFKRIKVIDPDRFDKATQLNEWEMANVMLQELEEAYVQVFSSGQDKDATSMSSVVVQKHPQSNNTSEIDLHKTQSYLNEVVTLCKRAQPTQIVGLDENNHDQHLKDLTQYIAVSFEVQQALASLDETNIDPLALELGAIINKAIIQISQFVTERIPLIARSHRLAAKYPISKTWSSGLIKKAVPKAEYEGDQDEIKLINERLIELGKQVGEHQSIFEEELQCILIKLCAKYSKAVTA